MMKKIFAVTPAGNLDVLFLIVRVAIAALMLVHGLPKLEMLLTERPLEFVNFLGMGPALSLALTVFAEVVCSIFILFGLGTRLAVIPLIVTMLVAVFYIHWKDAFIQQEMGLHYLLAYGILLVCGSGKYSADNLVFKKNQPRMQAAG